MQRVPFAAFEKLLGRASAPSRQFAKKRLVSDKQLQAHLPWLTQDD